MSSTCLLGGGMETVIVQSFFRSRRLVIMTLNPVSFVTGFLVALASL